jgi:DnaA family protein
VAAGRNTCRCRPCAARAQAIRGFGGSELLAIDDLDAIAGDRDAEHALFDLYNRCRAERATLLFAASAPAAQLGITLPTSSRACPRARRSRSSRSTKGTPRAPARPRA